VKENILVDPHSRSPSRNTKAGQSASPGGADASRFPGGGKACYAAGAIAKAQGLREDAGQRFSSATPSRRRRQAQLLIRRIIARDLFGAGDPSLNIRLYARGGPLPESARSSSFETSKAGRISVQGGSETTVLQMLALAEGLEKFASDQLHYRRRSRRAQERNSDTLKKILDRKSPDVLCSERHSLRPD